MVATSMEAGITSECPSDRFSRISHDFHTRRRRNGTDRCKFSRNKRNQRLFECNLDLTSVHACRRYKYFFLCSVKSTYYIYIVKLKHLYYFLINKNLSSFVQDNNPQLI